MVNIENYNFAGKRVIVRVDFNVPLDDNGKITGVFEPTGSIPSFMEDISRAKLDCDVSLFSKKTL